MNNHRQHVPFLLSLKERFYKLGERGWELSHAVCSWGLWSFLIWSFNRSSFEFPQDYCPLLIFHYIRGCKPVCTTSIPHLTSGSLTLGRSCFRSTCCLLSTLGPVSHRQGQWSLPRRPFANRAMTSCCAQAREQHPSSALGILVSSGSSQFSKIFFNIRTSIANVASFPHSLPGSTTTCSS